MSQSDLINNRTVKFAVLSSNKHVIYLYLENYSTHKDRTSTSISQEPVDFTNTNIAWVSEESVVAAAFLCIKTLFLDSKVFETVGLVTCFVPDFMFYKNFSCLQGMI